MANAASKRSMKWRKKNLDKVHATDRAWRQRKGVEWKLQTLAHYGPDGEARCSWPGCLIDDLDMLALDHVNDDGAADRRGSTGSRGGWGFYYRLVRLGFPAGFQTLCHNHNWKKEILRRRAENHG